MARSRRYPSAPNPPLRTVAASGGSRGLTWEGDVEGDVGGDDGTPKEYVLGDTIPEARWNRIPMIPLPRPLTTKFRRVVLSRQMYREIHERVVALDSAVRGLSQIVSAQARIGKSGNGPALGRPALLAAGDRRGVGGAG